MNLLKTDDPPVPSTRKSKEKCRTVRVIFNCPASFLFGVTRTQWTEHSTWKIESKQQST
jgi:hypothetical protein